jgi:hypothetical protein
VAGAVGKAGLRALAHLQGEPRKRVCVIRTPPGNARRDHVAVADRLDLLDVVTVDELVEAREKPIEEPDHLARVESARERGEVHYVGEEDAHVVEVVGDRVRIGLKPLRDVGREDVEQQRLDARLRGVPPSREGDKQQHRDERDDDDVEDVEGPDERLRQVGTVRPDDFGQAEREQDRGDEGRKPRPGPYGTVEGDCAERREERPQDHPAGLAEAAEHDGPGRGCQENQKQLRRPQRREVLRSREDDENDRRSGDVGRRRQCDPVFAHGPVQAAPEEPDREDDERHADEQALPEALVGRVVRIGSDREEAFVQRRGHGRRA